MVELRDSEKAGERVGMRGSHEAVKKADLRASPEVVAMDLMSVVEKGWL